MTAVAYGEALYSLAVEENVSHEIYSQIDAVKFAFTDNPELSKILDRPCSNTHERTGLIDRCFKDANLYLLNCIKIMSKRRVTSHFPEAADEFIKLYRKDNKIELVDVIVAVPMETDKEEKLKNVLEEKLNKKVMLNVCVDPGIMGGIIVRTSNSQIDGSVKSRLDSIEKHLNGGL